MPGEGERGLAQAQVPNHDAAIERTRCGDGAVWHHCESTYFGLVRVESSSGFLDRQFFRISVGLCLLSTCDQEPSVFLLGPFSPVDVGILFEGVPYRYIVEANWYETSLCVCRIAEDHSGAFEPDPIRSDCLCRHEEQQNSRVLQAVFDCRRDEVAWLDKPLI
jgi:hypothetical protein